MQMFLMVTITVLAGFLFSFGMLHWGLETMWLRYPLAVMLAYLIFLLQIHVWVEYQRRFVRIDEDVVKPSIDDAAVDYREKKERDSFNPLDLIDVPVVDEGLGVVVLLLIMLVVGVIAMGAVLYLIYLAPLMLTEVLVDAMRFPL